MPSFLKKCLVVLGCLLPIVIVLAIVQVVIAFNTYVEKLDDMYAAMNVGALIVDHLEATGAYPGSWDDLIETAHVSRTVDAEGIAYFKEHVDVKWEGVTLRAIYHAESIEDDPFPLVWCPSGAPAGPAEIHDANEMIYRYIQDHYFELLEKDAKRRYEASPSSRWTAPA